MRKHYAIRWGLALVVLATGALACNITRDTQAEVDFAITQTLAARFTEQARLDGEDPDPGAGTPAGGDVDQAPPPETDTPTTEPPTSVPPTLTPTVTPIPCDRAQFVSDVTVPDGSDYAPGETFQKTWRLKNSGSCTWTSGYDLVFHSGDAMGAPASVQMTGGTVPPGGSVDVSVQLTAPGSPGTYKGFFRLRNSSGVVFGIGDNADVSFWVEIEVLAALAPPDLVVTGIDFNPYPPTKNDPVTVTVKIKNLGGTTEEGFTVKWWPGENYPSPATSWNVNGGLDGGETKTLTYVYAGYPSTYGSINTMARIDTGDTVGESNEGNNSFLRNIKVDP